ncbi:gnrr-1, partial [Pristionchus pacificus]
SSNKTINCVGATPPDMNFNLPLLSIIATYIVVFIIAFIGNFTMFLILCRNQMVKVRRVHSLLLHMNIAHLMVTLLYMPKEIMHNYTIMWNGGDVLCKVCKFFDVFGISLSANILICISLDRFYSIFFPLYAMRARRSVNHMVAFAWGVSILTSAPQLWLFKEAPHPCYPWFNQCVSRDFIGEIPTDFAFYISILNIVQVYFLPLVVTLVCYTLILFKISSGARGVEEKNRDNGGLLRRSTAGNLERARSRTLRMTFVIVLAFLLCWSPYAIVMFLHFSTGAKWIPKDVRKLIYAFAVFNSAITPYLYGYFSFDVKKELKLLAKCSKATVSERHLSH